MCMAEASSFDFWGAVGRIIPLVEILLLAITSFIAYKSLVAWRDQAEYQNKRDAAKDIFAVATKCALWLFEARQSGRAPKEFLKNDISERSGKAFEEISEETLEKISSDAFAKYLLFEKKSDFDDLAMSLASGKKFFLPKGIEAIRDLGELRDAIIFHSDALVNSELMGVEITDSQESRSFCYRLGDDHSIEDRIEKALSSAASL